MKALTVQQPWAWAIIHAGKNVENRPRNTVGSYRGPLLIHSSQKIDRPAISEPIIDQAWRDRYGWGPASKGLFEVGTILGVVDVVGVHDERLGCCAPWGQRSHDGTRVVHIELANPRSLGFVSPPLQVKGHLWCWTPDDDLIDQVNKHLQLVNR